MVMKREQALALKQELEEGLEKWSKQVLEVQENNLKRAEEKVEDRNKLRRQRSREERRGREKRVMERRKESKERAEEELNAKQQAIKSKEKKEFLDHRKLVILYHNSRLMRFLGRGKHP